MGSSDCLFCGIVKGEIPATVVREDARTIAFMDINPATPGHCLVVPKAHSDDIVDADPEDVSACAVAASELSGKAISELGADGAAVISFCKPAAGQTVFHLHFHVIPRKEGDGLVQPWIPRTPDAGEIESAAEALRS
jgi:histidine triad (HIT) family protein